MQKLRYIFLILFYFFSYSGPKWMSRFFFTRVGQGQKKTKKTLCTPWSCNVCFIVKRYRVLIGSLRSLAWWWSRTKTNTDFFNRLWVSSEWGRSLVHALPSFAASADHDATADTWTRSCSQGLPSRDRVMIKNVVRREMIKTLKE